MVTYLCTFSEKEIDPILEAAYNTDTTGTKAITSIPW
jgi:hypothetical protein